MTTLALPRPDGTLEPYRMGPPADLPTRAAPARARRAYAAAHVVADPLADNAPGAPARLDWDATLAFRHRLWSLGLGVADAMDTAQRGTGLDWPATRELVRRTGAEAAACGGALLCGVGTDQLDGPPTHLDQVTRAFEEQLAVVEEAGARAVVMCSRQLAAVARGPEDYQRVYGRLLDQVRQPVVLHWLGEVFDPALRGYWGSTDLDSATRTVLSVIHEHPARVEGVKLSLLDAEREVALRRALPEGVRLLTGDDFHYPELIRGDQLGHSDALLGVFDPLAAVASAALTALDEGDPERFDALLTPTVPLARHLFTAPTPHYKTGVVFLAWLAGHQSHFTMVGGAQSGRSLPHLVRLFTLADRTGLLPDPELAAGRMGRLLALAGVGR
ncbi:dihydrodipicolinate synthase family protein [Streptomyces sp. NPDC005438]|uniref:dihydrodipicolinate synthase family protein n=1 Tax=Streptomyces sp. NPDC005438 TaxID=3156880 RepID=UPI0033B3C99E